MSKNSTQKRQGTAKTAATSARRDRDVDEVLERFPWSGNEAPGAVAAVVQELRSRRPRGSSSPMAAEGLGEQSAAAPPSYAERIGKVMAARWGTPEGTVRESVDALYQIVSVMEHDEAAGGALVSRVLEVTEALAVLADELEARGESERELELAIVYAGGPEGWKSWLLDDRAPADAPPLSPRTVRMARALLEEDDRPRTRWEWSQLLAVLEESAGSDQALARIRASAAKHSAEDEREAKAHVAAGTREGVEELLRRLDVAEARLDASRAPARRRASSAAEAKHGSPRARTTARA